MKKLITIFFASLAITLNATNYYVKNGGNDGAAGTSDATAWANISKVNSEWLAGTFAPGDSILFRRGDLWHGTITVSEAGSSGSPIVIGAYGVGNQPVIEGFQTLSSWTQYAGNIYYASLTCQSPTEMLLVDGNQKAKGRWPNIGDWMFIDTRISATQITDNELSSSPDWDGAELVVRENRWIISRHTITDHAGTSITFTTPLTYNPTGYGYFIQNSIHTLDVAWEWYYDSSASRLYIHTGGANPGDHTIRASVLDRGIDNSGGYEFITVTDLELRGFNTGTVYSSFLDYDPHGTTVQNCKISHSGGDAIYINRSSSDTIRDNTISYSNHAAVTLWGNYGNYCSVTGNDVSHTGEIPGAAFNFYGTSWANNAYNAIYTNPNYTSITNNRITYTGYMPINFRGTNALVQKNFIDQFCYVKDDGGGIYTYADNSLNKRVLNNIILNAVGSQQGVATPSTSAHGLYSDGESSNIHYEGNIVGYAIGAAYHGNVPRSVIMTNNKFFECGKFVDLWKYTTDGTFIADMRITKNHFVSSRILEELPAMIKYHNSSGQYYTGGMNAEITHFGEIDSNYYHINTECAVYIMGTTDTTAAPRSLARWVAEYGHDDHSSINLMQSYTINRLSANLLTNGTFDSNVTGWTATSPASISWNNGELGSGGCAQLSSTQRNYNYYWWQNANLITAAITGGAVSADSVYVLQLDGKSAINNKTLNLKLYSTGTGSTKQRYFTVGTTEQTKQVIFINPATVSSGATMRLALADDPVTTYVDNVSLHTAGITLRDYANTLHLIYNETETSKSYTLSATMEDPTGAEYSGTLVLQPWQGMILIGEGTIVPGGTPKIMKDKNGNLLKSRLGNFLKPHN